MNINRIKRDFKKIKKFLNLSETYLLLDVTSSEGFYTEKTKTIRLGIKTGYNRTLLIHECVHASGKQHNYKEGFESVIRFDTYSKNLEKQIFRGENEMRQNNIYFVEIKEETSSKFPNFWDISLKQIVIAKDSKEARKLILSTQFAVADEGDGVWISPKFSTCKKIGETNRKAELVVTSGRYH